MSQANGGGSQKSMEPKGTSPKVGSDAKIEQFKGGTGSLGEAKPYGCDKKK